MQRKEIFKKLEKDLHPKVEYNYKKTAKGIHIMKRTNEATEKEMLKELVKGFSQLLNRFNQFEKNQLEFNRDQKEFNKAIMQRLDNVEDKIDYVSHRLDNIVTKNSLSE